MSAHQFVYGILVAAQGEHAADDIWNEWTPAERSAAAEFADANFGSIIRKCCADLVAWKDALDAKYVCTCGPNEYCAADDCHGARGGPAVADLGAEIRRLREALEAIDTPGKRLLIDQGRGLQMHITEALNEC